MLTTQTLGTLAPDVQIPSYERSKLKSRIVHLGFGAFHRAHQALITEAVTNRTDSDWGICEVNLIGGEQLITELRSQDHLFSVTENGAEETVTKVIGVVTESLHPTFDGIDAVLEKLAEPQVAIISMTVTEKGYCIEPGSGRLDQNHALIAQDLASPRQPVSAIGVIVEALRLRRERGLPALTVLSCDNIPENGKVAGAAVLDYAAALDSDLAAWIREQITFPSTMVDRIVPAVTDDTLAEIEQTLGMADPCGVACEPFIQWVVEDNFIAGRPQWELGGAQLVTDVLPYEEMKLRMLNGSHSFLAYLGYLAGYQHISDTMQNAAFKQAAYRMMVNEQAPTLSVPEGTDLEQYARLLIARYSNPNLKHRTWQIAMDGSQKLPQRMLDSIRIHLARGTDFSHLALGVAAWMRYVSGEDEQGQPIDVRDPMAQQYREIYAAHGQGLDAVQALLSLESIFGRELADDPAFVKPISTAYQTLLDKGAKKAVEALASA